MGIVNVKHANELQNGRLLFQELTSMFGSFVETSQKTVL